MLRRSVVALVAALSCTVFAMPSESQAAGKIGVANPMRLSTQSAPGKDAEKLLKSMFDSERKQLESANASLNKQAEELRKQAGALKKEVVQERAQKIQKQAQEIDTKGSAYAQRLQRVQQEINNQMNEVLQKACANYASKNGYEMIVDATVVMFFDVSNDVTEGLIEEVNKIWKDKGGKFKITSK